MKGSLVLKEELIVMGLAEKIHSRLIKNFKYARTWPSYLSFKPMEISA